MVLLHVSKILLLCIPNRLDVKTFKFKLVFILNKFNVNVNVNKITT